MEVINYSLTQDATSMDLSDSYTGVGQISADIQETSDTRYLLSREFTLNDFVGAEHIGLVQQVNSRDGVTSLIAEDVLRRLNVDRYVNTTRTFDTEVTALEAIIAIFALAVGFDYDFRYVPGEHVPKFIMFPGGKVNLWNELKEYAAVYKFDLWVEGKTLVIDNLGTNRTEVTDLMAEGWSADISNVANWVEVIWFDNVIKGQGDTTQTDLEYYPRGNNEDAQILQADASETVEVELDVNAWVYTWNQPQCVEWVDNRVYDNTQGVYSVVGNDNLPITPSQWLSNGGSLTVEPTDDPAIVKVILKGANIPELAPFRIAMSSGNHYNSLHLTGWAYVWEKKTTRIYTGAGSELTSQEMGAQMESRHVQSLSQAYDVAYRVARSYAGPNLSLDVTSVGGVLPGTIMTTPDANFRVEQRVVGPLSVELRTGEHSTFEDFNEVWAGSVFEDFNNNFSGRLFQDFATSPLRRING